VIGTGTDWIWLTWAGEGLVVTLTVTDNGTTVMVGPVTNKGAQLALIPFAVIVKLPGAAYEWVMVVVVFAGTFVVWASPKPTMMGFAGALHPEELTVTETFSPTSTVAGDTVTDSAAQATPEVANTAHATRTRIFTRSFMPSPSGTIQPSRCWKPSVS
jgi:hypothetical protein